MSHLDLGHRTALSRRVVIAGGASIAAAAVAAGQALAAPKLTQKSVSYQDKPRGRARCDNCAQWLPPAGCKLVIGTIDPAGWCTVYAPKA